ncbi:MAG: GGDEF domain-containing protein [Thiohalomonas sp.]|nr:GGDEF domain-containing protein [Thiohalomonas sp.]
MSRAKRHYEPVSLMMMDIDYFKDINDNYGRPGGDVVLQAVAKIISAQCREEDIAARFGAEEFVILYDHCDLKDAQVKAENYRLLIEEAKPKQITVTSSFGVAQMKPEGEMVDDLIKRADLAFYQAKENGRNQVVVAD